MNMNPDETLKFFSAKLNIREDQLLAEVEYYNTQFSAYGNEIYRNISVRVAHWWNYKTHNWFARRIDYYLDKLVQMPNPLLIDVGFSIPYLQTDGRFAERRDIKALLIDKEENALDFYRAICKLVPTARQDQDDLVIGDIEDQGDLAKIRARMQSLLSYGDVQSILVVASEVIEHLKDERAFWKFVEMITRIWGRPIPIYITLPIGQKIPSHNLCFISEAEAFRYLEDRMVVEDSITLRPPADAVASPYHVGCICAFGQVR
jgi:hypothetical protein